MLYCRGWWMDAFLWCFRGRKHWESSHPSAIRSTTYLKSLCHQSPAVSFWQQYSPILTGTWSIAGGDVACLVWDVTQWRWRWGQAQQWPWSKTGCEFSGRFSSLLSDIRWVCLSHFRIQSMSGWSWKLTPCLFATVLLRFHYLHHFICGSASDICLNWAPNIVYWHPFDILQD